MKVVTNGNAIECMVHDRPDATRRRLHASICARFVEGVNGLREHLFEADHEEPSQPCLMLRLSFHELSFS